MSKIGKVLINVGLLAIPFLMMGCTSQPLSNLLVSDPTTNVAGTLASDIASSYSRDSDIQRIALLPLRTQYPNQRELAGGLNDSLRVELVNQKKYEIVADADMKRALSQLNTSAGLQNSGFIDRETLKRAGRLVNADAILDGSITKIDYDTHRVSVELIEIEKGVVVAASQAVWHRWRL